MLELLGGKEMLQKLLTLFTTEEKASMMLESPIIELIFITLFLLFIVAFSMHVSIFLYLRKTRRFVKTTNEMNIEPLRMFKQEFESRQTDEAFKTETFVQEKFSGWRILGIPIIGLMKLIQMTISVFILLGVLGTFIGLTISLGSINGADEQLIENVSSVLSGIDIAFYTSIVGMSFSLIMTILLKLLNTEFLLTDLMLTVESHLESHEKHGLHRVITVSEMIHESLGGVVSAFDGFKDYTSGLKESARDLALFNEGLAENLTQFQMLFHDMKSVSEGFANGIETLNENFVTLFNFFKNNDHKNEQILASFEKAASHMETMATKQSESFTVLDKQIGTWKNFTTTTIAEQSLIANSVAEISNETKGLVDTMRQEKDQLKQIFGQDLSTKLENISTYLRELDQGFQLFGQALTPLPETLNHIHHTQQTQNSLMEERISDLQAFNQSYNSHLHHHQENALAFDKNVRETTVIYENMANKNSQLLTEIENAITRLDQTFSKRDRELMSNVDLVKETLMTYVSTLEGTIGQKLETLIRNIDQSMYTQQDDLKRDFLEMRRMSEEINDNQQRTNQQLLRELTNEISELHRTFQSNNPSAYFERPRLEP